VLLWLGELKYDQRSKEGIIKMLRKVAIGRELFWKGENGTVLAYKIREM
jgi:hypothetical protein